MVWNIPLDKEHECNYLLTSLSLPSVSSSASVQSTCNTRELESQTLIFCKISLQNCATNHAHWHPLSQKHTGDRLKLFHLPAWLRALTDPVGLIPPWATKTGLSTDPTTQCQSASMPKCMNHLFVSVCHKPTTCSPYASLSLLPSSPSSTPFRNDSPTVHLVLSNTDHRVLTKERNPTGVLLGTVQNTCTHEGVCVLVISNGNVTLKKETEKQKVVGWIVR